MSECRYSTKRTFLTREAALDGILEIRTRCALERREYQELSAYQCPDDAHWHLSHYRQGKATCSTCGQAVPSWKGWWWVIGKHDVNGKACPGEGSRGEKV